VRVSNVTRRFAFPAERVFDAFLDPAKAGKFMFATETGTMVRSDVDARVGGRCAFVDRRSNEGDVEHTGEYLAIERPHRLAFTLQPRNIRRTSTASSSRSPTSRAEVRSR